MNPFTKIKTFVDSIVGDVTGLFYSVAILGIVFCCIMIWRGSEENVPRFQKGIVWAIIAIAVVALSKIIVTWVKTGVA
jgi:type IV secretory pathway VirB2 component (pilin)